MKYFSFIVYVKNKSAIFASANIIQIIELTNYSSQK